jgi:uncharacterized membrane protein
MPLVFHAAPLFTRHIKDGTNVDLTNVSQKPKAIGLRRPAWLTGDTLFVIVVLALSAILLVMPDLYQSPFVQSVARYRGRVISADNSAIQQFAIVKAGSQSLRIEILSGPYRGQITDADNHLIGKMETDKMFKPGDVALIIPDLVEAGRVISVTAYDHYRMHIELLLFLLFAGLLIGFAGWSGARALLSFLFALLCIWKVLLPGILLGWDPVLLSLLLVIVLSAVTLCLVAGVGRRAFVALLGATLGIVLTCSLALLLLPPFRLHGAIQPFSETLLYTGFAGLNLTRLFLAAIFLGASGAVMDVAIDVSAAMHEVVQKRPDLPRRELIESGFAVGRAMTSTMITTLLMAYVSGYMALLMVFLAQGVPPLNIINTNYMAAEILKTIVGSLGLVTVAPFTALVGGVLYAGRGQHSAAMEASGKAV